MATTDLTEQLRAAAQAEHSAKLAVIYAPKPRGSRSPKLTAAQKAAGRRQSQANITRARIIGLQDLARRTATI